MGVRFFSALAVSALATLSLATTCVTSSERKGAAGPWVGEVVNMSDDDVVNDVFAHAQVTDATGSSSFTGLGSNIGHSCPSVLWPGEGGAFEMTVSGDGSLPKPELPLKATFEKVAFDRPGAGGLTRDGLVVRYLSKDDDAGTVVAELRNDATVTYAVAEVCAVLRGTDGKVAAVSFVASMGPPAYGQIASLAPGEVDRLKFTFREMPQGTFEFFAMGADISPKPPCCMP
jgi:hypothetical protein